MPTPCIKLGALTHARCPPITEKRSQPFRSNETKMERRTRAKKKIRSRKRTENGRKRFQTHSASIARRTTNIYRHALSLYIHIGTRISYWMNRLELSETGALHDRTVSHRTVPCSLTLTAHKLCSANKGERIVQMPNDCFIFGSCVHPVYSYTMYGPFDFCQKRRKHEKVNCGAIATHSHFTEKRCCWWLRFCEREKFFFVTARSWCRFGCRCCCFCYCQTMANRIAWPDIVQNICVDFKWRRWCVCAAGLYFQMQWEKKHENKFKGEKFNSKKNPPVRMMSCERCRQAEKY